MSEKHLPPTGSKCPKVSSISAAKLAARFMNLDVDRGAGFTDHEGAVGNDSAEQWGTAFPTKSNKPSNDPDTDPSHLQAMVRSHQNQRSTLQNIMGSLVSTADKMAARLHKTAKKSDDTSSDSSSSGSEEARSRHKFSLRPYLPRGERRPTSFGVYVSGFTALIIGVSQAGHPVAGLLDHLRFLWIKRWHECMQRKLSSTMMRMCVDWPRHKPRHKTSS